MAESSGKTSKVARRLRAIVERLEHGPPPPPSRLGWMEAVTARWEKILDEEPSQPSVPLPAAGPPAPETGRRDGEPAAAAAAVQIWCDGSCSPNPGAGGWGAIVQTGGGREELSGAAPDTTNNIMEMT
ncbi:MAG: RNase H family protein, partial [bacterium]